MDTQFLSVPGGKIAYDDSGSGQTVLYVPGMGDLRGEFRFMRPQLEAAGYRVVTMDVRGHGETSTSWQDYSVAGVGADIVALLRRLDAGPAVIAGSSMAAGAAVWAAVEAPELVSGLVLLGPAVHGEINWGYRLALDVLLARLWGASAWLMYYKRLFPTRKPADLAEYSAGLKRNLSQPGRLEALHAMMAASKSASESRLTRVSIPSISIMGSKDPDFKDPTAEVKWVAGQLKGSYRIIDGAGHYPQTEMPEMTGPIVLEFLKTLQPELKMRASD
jgi:pimeloyl-ACP methyl ester carboxylesterase